MKITLLMSCLGLAVLTSSLWAEDEMLGVASETDHAATPETQNLDAFFKELNDTPEGTIPKEDKAVSYPKKPRHKKLKKKAQSTTKGGVQ